MREGIEQVDLLSCWVHDAIIDDSDATRYAFSGIASKARALNFTNDRAQARWAGGGRSETAARSRRRLQHAG